MSKQETIIYKVDPCFITGEITYNKTPLIIIRYICYFYDIDIDSSINDVSYDNSKNGKLLFTEDMFKTILSLIKKNVSVTISDIENLSSNDEQLIAKLLNPFLENNIRWNRKKLKKAFMHLMSYRINEKINIPDKNVTFGNITNKRYDSINVLILYRICSYFGIKTNLKTTEDEMIRCFNMLREPINLIRNQLIGKINNLSHNTLVNIMNSEDLRCITSPIIKYEKDEDEINKIVNDVLPNVDIQNINFNKSLKKCIGKFNKKFLLSRVEPISHEEAIVVSALKFGIDISYSINPMKQFLYIKHKLSNGCIDGEYLPIDDDSFFNFYISNPSWFNIRINWCSKLDSILYTNQDRKKFLESEGYNFPSKESSEYDYSSMLFECRNSNNFYLGINPHCHEDKTFIYFQDIQEVDKNLIICFGSCISEKMIYLTPDELTNFFKEKKVLISPTDNVELTEESIKKLKNITEIKFKRTLGKKIPVDQCVHTDPVRSDFYTLYLQICELESIKQSISAEVKNFMLCFFSLNEKIKLMIKNLFNTLIELGLSMRGKGVKDVDGNEIVMPLESSKTGFFSTQLDHLYDNITINAASFWDHLSNIEKNNPDMYKIIINLKCVCLSDNHSKNPERILFGKRSQRDLFLNPKEKFVDCIKNLINIKKDNSCVRYNSNLILVSAIYYSEMIGYSTNIDIDKISFIS